MKRKFLSILTYNYFAQLIFHHSGLFKTRFILRKIYNNLFRNPNINLLVRRKFTKSSKTGWSIVVLTYDLDAKLLKKTLEYQKILNKKKYEIIIVTNLNTKKIHHKSIKVINLNSRDVTLGKKRNIGIKLSKFNKIIMSLDYFKINNIKINELEKEIRKKDLLIPKIKTLDYKRYIDWMFLDFPKIGKCFCPYNLKDQRYMYFHGSYLILKKNYLIENKFSNYLDHKQGEDVEWSLRIRNKIKFALTNNIELVIERFSYQSEVLNDKNFIKNNILIDKKFNAKR